MLEFQWPWVFLALPLPYLVYRFVTPASRFSGSALQVPFYQHLSSIAGEQQTSERVADNGSPYCPGWSGSALFWLLPVRCGWVIRCNCREPAET